MRRACGAACVEYLTQEEAQGRALIYTVLLQGG
jgi:hypothetical protein